MTALMLATSVEQDPLNLPHRVVTITDLGMRTGAMTDGRGWPAMDIHVGLGLTGSRRAPPTRR